MIALIFANGNLDFSADREDIATLLAQADFLIAADGGANHCTRLGITPDILLGDLDSIKPPILAKLESEGVAIHRHPARKDATDLELALNLAVEKGAQTIWLIGALGGRWDMSLANIMLAASDKYKDQDVLLLGQDCSMQILHPGKIHAVSGTSGKTISFLPLKDDVYGVTLIGCEYPLQNHTIAFGSTLGVSNILKDAQATVQHSKGVLLCVLALT